MNKTAWMLYGEMKPSEKEALIKAAQEQAVQDTLESLKLANWGVVGRGLMNAGKRFGSNLQNAGRSAATAFQGAKGLGQGLNQGAKAFLGSHGGQQAALMGGALMAGGAMGKMLGGQRPQQQAPVSPAMQQQPMMGGMPR